MKSKTMKLKYLVLFLLGAMALPISAQEQTVPVANRKPAHKTAFMKDRGHWFITLQGGVGSALATKYDGTAKSLTAKPAKPLLETLGQAYSLSIGKEHNPYFATRLQFTGGELPYYWENAADPENPHLQKTAYIGGHFDFMLDLVNLFAPYKERRVFHLIPFAGLGYQYRFKDQFESPLHTGTINAGMQLMFHLAKRFDFVIEGQAVYQNLSYQNEAWIPELYHGLSANLTAGFNIRLGRTAWSEVVPMDMNLINDLNSQINSLRAENEEMSRQLPCPECPEVAPAEVKTEVKTILADKAILFRFDSDKIGADQKVILHDIAQFVKENNAPILLVGYADQTGNSDYNMKLSERRANAVKNALVNEFGVSEDMITTEWEGASNQFETKAWNRVVIVRSK